MSHDDRVDYVKVDSEGRIIGGGTCQESAFAAQGTAMPSGTRLLRGRGGPDLHYVRNGEIRKKAPATIALEIGDKWLHLTGLPMPCTVLVGRTPYRVEDGALELTFDFPGRHRLSVTSIHCRNWNQEVEV